MLFHSHLISVVLAAVASSVIALTLPVYQQQLPLGVPDPDARTRQDAASRSAAATGAAVASASGSRKLHGRFLHITDIHPDPHYKPGASISSACHRNRPRKQKKRAGPWGAPYNECDAPMNLVERTFRWLETHWADEIDFVVWTGDNARHDNDRNVPRTLREIYDLNKDIAQRMHAIFGRRGIPVVPSLGNNDVWPHNILSGGPNDIISRFSSIWSSFIPFPSYQVFQRGAYYSVEVVPNHVAVVALNTMFFYDSNKAVGGCELRDRDDPGNLQMDWLEVQLRTFRDRGMHAWLTGHVPPSSGNYFPECHVRYAELSLRFQDTILGHLFGHMNNDHFYFLEAIDVEFPPEDSDANISLGTDADALAHDGLYDELMDDFTALSKVAKRRSEDDYAAVNVAPSVVPNPYIPSFRVFSYNVTEASGLSISALADRDDLKRQRGNLSRDGGEGVMGDGDVNDQKKKKKKKKHGGDRSPGHHRGGVKKGDRFKMCEGDEAKQESWRCHLTDEWHSDADAPCRTNKLWTPLGYAQYHIPPSRLANADVKPKFKLQYLTYPLGALHPPEPPSLEANADVDGKKGKGKDKFAYPVPPRNLPKSLRTPPLNRTQSKYAPYGMDDLTVGSWLALADKLGGSGDSKLKKRFRRYMYGVVKEKVDEAEEEEEELVG